MLKIVGGDFRGRVTEKQSRREFWRPEVAGELTFPSPSPIVAIIFRYPENKKLKYGGGFGVRAPPYFIS
jgi:hypothetical protein